MLGTVTSMLSVCAFISVFSLPLLPAAVVAQTSADTGSGSGMDMDISMLLSMSVSVESDVSPTQVTTATPAPETLTIEPTFVSTIAISPSTTIQESVSTTAATPISQTTLKLFSSAKAANPLTVQTSTPAASPIPTIKTGSTDQVGPFTSLQLSPSSGTSSSIGRSTMDAIPMPTAVPTAETTTEETTTMTTTQAETTTEQTTAMPTTQAETTEQTTTMTTTQAETTEQTTAMTTTQAETTEQTTAMPTTQAETTTEPTTAMTTTQAETTEQTTAMPTTQAETIEQTTAMTTTQAETTEQTETTDEESTIASEGLSTVHKLVIALAVVVFFIILFVVLICVFVGLLCRNRKGQDRFRKEILNNWEIKASPEHSGVHLMKIRTLDEVSSGVDDHDGADALNVGAGRVKAKENDYELRDVGDGGGGNINSLSHGGKRKEDVASYFGVAVLGGDAFGNTATTFGVPVQANKTGEGTSAPLEAASNTDKIAVSKEREGERKVVNKLSEAQTTSEVSKSGSVDDALNQGERNLRTLEEMKASEPQCTSPESIPVAKESTSTFTAFKTTREAEKSANRQGDGKENYGTASSLQKETADKQPTLKLLRMSPARERAKLEQTLLPSKEVERALGGTATDLELEVSTQL